VGVVVYLQNIDLSAFRDHIGEQVTSFTGRSFEVRGGIDSRLVSLRPAVVLKDVALGNVSWGKHPYLATASRIELRLDASKLLRNEIAIKELIVVDPNVLLETNVEGKGNWILDGDDDGAESFIGEIAITFEKVRFSGGSITYNDGMTGRQADIALGQFALRTKPGDPRMVLETKGSFFGAPLEIDGTFDRLDALLFGSEPYKAEVQLKLRDSDFQIELATRLRRTPVEIVAAVASETIDLEMILGLAEARDDASTTADVKPAPLPFELLRLFDARIELAARNVIYRDAKLIDLKANVAVRDGHLDLELLSGRFLDGAIGGTLATALKPPASGTVDLTFQARQANLGLLEQALEFGSGNDMKIDLDIKTTAKGATLDDLLHALQGRVDVSAGAGPVDESRFGFLTQDLFGGDKSSQDRNLARNCLIGSFELENGVAANRILLFDASTFNLIAQSGGSIDLRKEVIDMIVHVHSKVVNAAKIVEGPVRIHGPLASPSVDLVPMNVAVSVTTSPLRIIGKLLEEVVEVVGLSSADEPESESKLCDQAIAAQAKHQVWPKAVK
jgi:uncharacterized protein involved in outer membrane biogenesis